MNRVTKRAHQIVPGDLVVERDGAYFEVTEVGVVDEHYGYPQRRGKRLVFALKNVNGYVVAPEEAIVYADDLIACLAAEEGIQ